ncbi:MAG: phage tail tape measure protein [Clostridia bacterium]
MAEDIGALAVSIGMDASGFTTGMTKINSNLRTLNSEFKMNTAAAGLNGTALDRLKIKSATLTSTMALQQNKVNALDLAYQRSVIATGEDSAATQNLAQRLNLARASLSNMENSLATTNAQIATQSSRWTRLGTTLNAVGTKMKSVGDGMAKVGKQLTMKVTAPILAIGAASIKAGMDFEASMSNVQAIGGASGADLEALKNKALEMGRATSKSAKESADALSYMALAGWDAKTSIAALEPILRLSEAGNMDLALTSDIVTDSMSALGIKVEELPGYLDKMAKTSGKSNTSVQQLGEAMVIAGGTFKNLNVPMGEANAILGILANRGMKGSEAANSLNSIMINLTTGAGQAGEAMSELNIEAFDGEGKFKGMGNVLKEVEEKTKGMTEEQRNMYLSMIGGKTQLTTLQALLSGVGEEFDQLQSDINNSDGALNKMAKTMQNNLKGKMTALKSALEGMAISISNTLIPMVTKVTAKIQEWTDKFNSLTDSQKENIVKIGLYVAAAGPLLFVIGKIVSIGGTLVTGLGMISTALGVTTVATAGAGVAGGVAATGGIAALGASIAAVLIPIAPFLIAAAAIVGAGLLIKNKLQEEVIPEVDLFADSVVTTSKQVKDSNGVLVESFNTTVTKISEGTKKAVEGYLALDKQSTDALNKLFINSTTITGKTVTDVTTKYNAMNTQVKTAIDTRFADEYKTMQDFYAKSDVLTKVEEAKALLKMKTDNAAEKAEEDKVTKEILAIYQKAKEQNRALTLADEEAIKVIQNRKKTTAIKTLSTTEAESNAILNRMKDYGTRVTAEQAGAEIKNANKSRDGSVKAANEQYNKTVAAIKATYNDGTPASKKTSDALIKDAKKTQTESVAAAQKMRTDVVAKIVAMGGESVAGVDTMSGNMKTSWTKLKSWFASNPIMQKIKTAFEDPSNPNSQYQKNIKNNATGTNNFSGGLTTMHEKGYEVYNLNKGSQILNHEASLDLMTKTAQEVAKGVLANSQGNKNGNGLSLNIENFVNARQQDVAALAVELQFYLKQQNLGRG